MAETTELTISLSSIDKVKAFVAIVSAYGGDFDLSSSRYTVDAKSIMGIFSLDLSSPLKLAIYDAEAAGSIKEQLKDFIV
ncbi:hypothetical protein AGMMS49975_00930 [Clostridia bacterium]|nr:hypothetical protein AGMMS49975_00930 [Clostridia bacterium]GHU77221.1 hypothetical protein FACS1894188_11070 [Clostridia bacterium]